MSDDRTEKPIEERRRVVGRELFTQLDRLRNHRRIRGIRMQDLKRTEAGENTVHPRHPGQCPAFRKAISQDRVKADLGGCHTTDQISRERPHWVGEDTWTRCEDFERISTYEVCLEQNVESLFTGFGPCREVCVFLDVPTDAPDLEVADPLGGALVVRGGNGIRTHFSEMRPR